MASEPRLMNFRAGPGIQDMIDFQGKVGGHRSKGHTIRFLLLNGFVMQQVAAKLVAELPSGESDWLMEVLARLDDLADDRKATLQSFLLSQGLQVRETSERISQIAANFKARSKFDGK